jgi:hypothetical protein
MQVLQPLRPCMRVVMAPAELKSVIKASLACMERERLAKLEAQRAAQEAKLRQLLEKSSALE